MARVYFRYSKGVREELAAKYGEPMTKVIKRLKAREEAGEKIVWPRETAPSNGTWWLDYRNPSGERAYDSTTAATKGAAEQKLRDRLNEVDDIRAGKNPVSGKPMRFEDAAASMLAARVGSPSYRWDEMYLRRHVVPVIGKKYLIEVTSVVVDEVGALMRTRGYAPATICMAYARIHYVFTWARKAQVFMGQNPMDDVSPVVIPKRSPKSFSDEQLDRFLAAAGRWGLLFQVASILGPRKGEMCGLQWTDFIEEFEYPDGVVGPVLHIKRSYDKPHPKGKRERLVPVPDDVAEALVAARAESRSRYVFPAPSGLMRKDGNFDPNDIFRRTCIRAGLVRAWRVTCQCGHDEEMPKRGTPSCPRCKTLLLPKPIPVDMTFRHLRSTAATRVGDLRKAQALLGHASATTTEKHYHAAELDALREAMSDRAVRRRARAQARDKGGTPPPTIQQASSRKRSKTA